MAIALSIIALIGLFVVTWFLGGFELMGSFILNTCFPTTYPTKGDKVCVFINGQYNRTATVTACCTDYMVLYDAVRCPIDNRGRFYAIGEDANGNILVYVDDLKHWRLVKRAEWIRKIFNAPEEYATMTPFDDGRTREEIFPGVKAAEKLPEISEEGMP